jgi:hypothetical protein
MPLSGSQSAPPPRVISGEAAANLVHRREVGAAERHRDIDRLVRLRLELVLRRRSGLAGAVGEVLVDAASFEGLSVGF